MSARRYAGETAWRRVRQVVRGDDPAAGLDPSVVVPAGHVYRVRAAFAQLVTDATVANREARLQATDGVAAFLDIAPASAVVASSTTRYAWLPGAGGYVTGAGQVMPLPELDLPAGWVVQLLTGGLVAGDNWTALALIVDDLTARGGPADLADVPDLRVEVVGVPTG